MSETTAAESDDLDVVSLYGSVLGERSLIDPTELSPHPRNEAIYGEPEIDGGFVESIENNGVLEPLVIKRDKTIISGHRRQKGAVEAGLDRVPVRKVEFDSEDLERRTLIELNRYRERTDGIKLKEGRELMRLETKRAKERQGERTDTSAKNFAQVSGGRATKIVAEQIGMSDRTFEKGLTVYEAADEGNEVARKQVEKLEQDSTSIHAAHRAVKKEKQIEELEAEPPQLPDGSYRVLVADPPWEYGNQSYRSGNRGAVDYPTMELSDLKELDVPAADDSVLWLWTTNAFMSEAHELLDVWGFEQKTILTWVKERMGVGHWLRNQTEHCLLATRGNPTVDLEDQTTYLKAPRREHSRKPDEFYELVESLCPGSKYELFARQAREGWEAFGDETTKF
jgi:N6-adenosine-specific RNA methylase IME4